MSLIAKPWVIATGNSKKRAELVAQLEALPIRFCDQDETKFALPEETGLTFVENALLKARAVAKQTGCSALADDSGLVVPSLQGAPGIYSARYAGAGASDAKNVAKLLDQMQGMQGEQRAAFFICVLVALTHESDPMPVIAQGVWSGSILEYVVGQGGFGYDPVFWVPSIGCSAAELPAPEKNKISHRAMAMEKLKNALHYKINFEKQGV